MYTLSTGRIKLVLFCTLLFFAAGLKAQVFRGVPFIRTFGTTDYMAGIQNWDIGQDSRGFLYFANNLGLLEYDGHHWNTFPVKAGSKVRCLNIGPDGRIYVGLQGEFGYFSPSVSGQWVYTSLSGDLSPEDGDFDETWRIYRLQDKVYFCTFRNIYEYDGKELRIIQPPNPIEFSFMANKRLYVLDWERGLTWLEGSNLIPAPGGDFFSHKRIVSIVPADQQQLLIVTRKLGLFLYDGLRVKKVVSAPADPFAVSILNCAVRLHDGTFAIGTQSEGFFLLNQKLELQQQIDKAQGLNDHTVVSLFQDRHQNLWVGHNNGISYVELSSPFTLLDEKTQVPGSGYAAALHGDTLYLGTNNGLFAGTLHPWKGMQFEQVRHSQGQVYHLSRQGNELLMGHHNGAFRIRNSEAVAMSPKGGSWQFLQLEKNPGLMLEGTYQGFSLYRQNGAQWQYQQEFSGFDESSRIFEEDAEGNIWMAHGYKGIYKLRFDPENGKLKMNRFYGQADGLPSNVLNNLFKINNRLVFTGETGVYDYNPEEDRFQLNSSLTGVFGAGDHIQKLRQDANGRIYFLSNNKSGSVLQDNFGKWEADTSRFNKIHQLLNDDLDFLAVLNTQNVLFGAKEGFIHFNPTLTAPEMAPLQVYIRRVDVSTPRDSLLFGGNFWFGDQLATRQPENGVQDLPYESNSIRFRFSSPYFDATEHLSYQYKLEGFDQDWSSRTTQTFKEYTNLAGGTYTFKVRSRNIYGELSPEDTYEFRVLPPWYQSAWAYAVYSLLAAGMFSLGIIIVDRKHRREKELLQAKQQKALQQKKIELDTLSRRSEEEIIRLRNEKLESEITHKNKELATSTMHIVSKNEFIGEIKQHLNGILKESAHKGISKDLNKIVKQIDQNMATDKDWEHFQIHFDRVHGDFSKRLKGEFPNLTPQEMKLCAYLRLNLSTKEIAQLMHISVRGVEISRYRLRKKLELERQDNLLDFILNF